MKRTKIFKNHHSNVGFNVTTGDFRKESSVSINITRSFDTVLRNKNRGGYTNHNSQKYLRATVGAMSDDLTTPDLTRDNRSRVQMARLATQG